LTTTHQADQTQRNSSQLDMTGYQRTTAHSKIKTHINFIFASQNVIEYNPEIIISNASGGQKAQFLANFDILGAPVPTPFHR